MKVVYVVGSGHSGSTILDLVLGSHPRIAGVGEMKNLGKLLRRQAEISSCTCGEAFERCTFWSEVFRRVPEVRAALQDGRYHPLPGSAESLARLTGRGSAARHREQGRYDAALLQAIGGSAGADVVVDSSKSPFRMLRLLDAEGLDVHVLHLYKSLPDYRASMEIRHPRALDSFALWTRTNAAALLLGRRAPHLFRLRHADFLSDPARWAEALCRFVGVAWAPEMLEYWKVPHHNVSGNVLRFSPVPVGAHPRREWRPRATDRLLYHGLGFSLLERLLYRPSGQLR